MNRRPFQVTMTIEIDDIVRRCGETMNPLGNRSVQVETAASLSPRVACFTPLPPAKTGIANYAAGFLPHLRNHFDLDVYVNQRRVECFPVTEKITVDHLVRFPARAAEYDLLLYEMGNSVEHAGIFELLMHYPGIVHLHDPVLHHFYLEFYFHRGRARDYARKLRALHGRDGAIFARCVMSDFGGSLGYFELAMREEVIRRSIGVVVHSHWAHRVLRRDFPSLPILRIEHPSFTHTLGETDGAGFRQRFGIPTDAFVVSSLGFATPAKRIDKLLEALCFVRQEVPSVRLLIVGKLNPASRLEERAAALGVADLMVATGYVEEGDLWNALAASDLLVNLRFPTAGEASGPLMQALALGKPVVVTGIRQFLELPDSICEKVPVGEREVPELVRVLVDLAKNPNRRRQMGAEGRKFAETQAAPETAARALAAFARALVPVSRLRLQQAIASIQAVRKRSTESLLGNPFRGLPPGISRTELERATGVAWIEGTDEADSWKR